MGKQNEYNILRRYMSLRALRLLHLSAEVSHLAGDLGFIVEKDRSSGDPERALFETYYQVMRESKDHPGKALQIKGWSTLSAKLREYGEHPAQLTLIVSHRRSHSLPGEEMLLYRQLSQLPAVDHMHLKNFRAWMKEAHGGHNFLHGAEALLWERDFEHDLTSLCIPADQQDPVTRFVYSTVLPFYHETIGQRHKTPLEVLNPFNGQKQSTPTFEYSDKAILAMVNIFSASVASLIPSISALGLYFIHSSLDRLGAIVAFTFIFSMLLCSITNVKRSECFGITAAFSAVLVVFIGNNDNAGCNHTP